MVGIRLLFGVIVSPWIVIAVSRVVLFLLFIPHQELDRTHHIFCPESSQLDHIDIASRTVQPLDHLFDRVMIAEGGISDNSFVLFVDFQACGWLHGIHGDETCHKLFRIERTEPVDLRASLECFQTIGILIGDIDSSHKSGDDGHLVRWCVCNDTIATDVAHDVNFCFGFLIGCSAPFLLLLLLLLLHHHLLLLHFHHLLLSRHRLLFLRFQPKKLQQLLANIDSSNMFQNKLASQGF